MSWHVGAQLYVWMQYCDAKKIRFDDHLRTIFEGMGAGGYEGIEGFIELVDSPQRIERLQKVMANYQIAEPSFYANSRLHEVDKAGASIENILKLAPSARKVGARFINTNPEPTSWRDGREKTDDELKVQAEALNELGRRLKSEDLQLVIHGHAPEFKSDGREKKYGTPVRPGWVRP